MSVTFFLILMTTLYVSVQWFSIIYERTGENIFGMDENDPKRTRQIVRIRDTIVLILVPFIIWVFVSPFKRFYRHFRYGTIRALGNLVIAPFGKITFSVFLLGEILTDCIIQLEDVGRIFFLMFNQKLTLQDNYLLLNGKMAANI